MIDREQEPSAVRGGVRLVLRGEAFLAMIVAGFAYAHTGATWQKFAWLFLVPDLSFAGYLGGARVGALTYNLAHSYVLPLALLGWALSLQPGWLPYVLIWLAHIGFDRTLGYGLKYSSAFGHTHLGRIGKQQ